MSGETLLTLTFLSLRLSMVLKVENLRALTNFWCTFSALNFELVSALKLQKTGILVSVLS